MIQKHATEEHVLKLPRQDPGQALTMCLLRIKQRSQNTNIPSITAVKAGRRNNSAGPLQACVSVHFTTVTHMLTIKGMIFVEKSSGIKKHFDSFKLVW